MGVVFANQSGNDPCDWLPLASELARGGRRVAVFTYVDSGSADAEVLSSVRLKTTFGIAHQTSANAAPSSLSRSDGSVSHGSIVS